MFYRRNIDHAPLEQCQWITHNLYAKYGEPTWVPCERNAIIRGLCSWHLRAWEEKEKVRKLRKRFGLRRHNPHEAKELPKVLFVDDYADLVKSYQMVFKRKFKIIRADSIDEAIDLLNSQPFDLIVVDYYLPDGLGTQLAEDVADVGIPIILTSGDANKIYEFGEYFDAALPKPVDLGSLEAVMTELLA